MSHHKSFSSLVLALFISVPVFSQYQFESKKAEKLYQKIEEEYANDYDYTTILNNEKTVLSLWDAKQDTLTALMYSILGEAYFYELGDVLTGLKYFEKEFELRTALKDKGFDFDERGNLFAIASINAEVGNFTKSESIYLDLLGKDEKKFGRKSKEFVETLLALADHYTLSGDTEKGKDLLKKYSGSIEKGTWDKAMALRFLADYQEIAGEFSKAEKNLLESLAILEETGYFPSLDYVYVTSALGILYTNKGQYPLAEEIFQKALDVFDRLGSDDEASRADVEFNLGQVYFELGQYDLAAELYLKILEIDKEYDGEESFYVATTSFVLGDIYYESGDLNTSEQYLKSAEKIFIAIGETKSQEYARTLNNLGRLYTAKGDYEKAKAYGQKALESFATLFGKEHYNYANTLSNASEVYMKLNEIERAENYLNDSRKIRAKQLGVYNPQYAKSSRKLAILNWQKEDQKKALEYFNEVFDNYFSQINNYFPILSEDEKSKFYYNNLKPTFEQFNSFIVENRAEDQKLIELMYNYQLSTKGLILYATTKVKESIANSGDSVLIAKYDTWIGQKEQLAQLFSAGDMNADVRTRKIDSLMAAANELEGQLSKESSVFASNFASRDLTWRDVKAKLKPGEAAVEILRFRDFDPKSGGNYTDEVYYAALIVKSETEEAPEMVVMRNGKEMETKYLSNYRNAIRFQVNENFSYRLFWRPISNKLQGITKVYFSPDGVYNQISVYTLQNPESKKFTIDEFEIQLVTNTKDLVAFNWNKQTDFKNDSYLFGYPNYNMGAIDAQKSDKSAEDKADAVVKSASENRGVSRGGERGARGARGADKSFEELTRSGGLPRGIRGNLMRYMRSNQLLALLPGTQREVNLIDSLIIGNALKTKVYMSNDAIEERIKEVKSPQTLHIATHGFFLEYEEEGAESSNDKYVGNPLLRSGLILAGANSYISTGDIGADIVLKDDGILTAYEAMNLNLDDTELVVLSACETGLGEIKNGEGVFGLQRAFQIAGAEAIIMSMWSVDDDATQELMTNFYEEWLTTGDKHKAFINAQKRLKDKWKYPYYWGAFVMIGN